MTSILPMAPRFEDIDWDLWQPQDVATLMFVLDHRAGEVLLIRKLRGLGAGMINAPGGRTEPGEALVDAAVRETREEVGISPLAPRLRGELRFEFTDGYRLAAHVFSADAYEGVAHATAEAIPLWTPLSAIPYAEMWSDDALWVPLMLAGRTPFLGCFVYDGEAMVGPYTLVAHDPAAALFERLGALGIAHETFAHAPVFTVPEAKAARAAFPGGVGAHTKNLFVRDKKGRMWLVTVREDIAVDLDALAKGLGAKNLSFASPERLRRHLGVEPGSVTPLALGHDVAGDVTFVLDRAIASSDAVWCHPLTNDRTTRLSGADLGRFALATGHAPLLIDV